jgi:hypothetical protein
MNANSDPDGGLHCGDWKTARAREEAGRERVCRLSLETLAYKSARRPRKMFPQPVSLGEWAMILAKDALTLRPPFWHKAAPSWITSIVGAVGDAAPTGRGRVCGDGSV